MDSAVIRRRIAGVPADCLTLETAVEVVDRAAGGDRPFKVLVTNANKAWQAARDGRLASILAAADLAVPEWALAWAGRFTPGPRVHHVGGITLMVRLLEAAERSGRSVYLLGAAPDVVADLESRLRSQRPGLRIAGSQHGYFDEEGWETIVREIARTRPDLLFVALGSPQQEYRIQELSERVQTLRVAMGVGGSFDVLAGRKREAPRWARGRGLEWLYRLAQDPRRLWKRYLTTNLWFVTRVLRERWDR